MKRKILTLLSVTTALALSSVCVMAQTTSEQTTEQTSVASDQNGDREFDKNTLMGTVLSCNDETITIQTSPGRRGGRQLQNQSSEDNASEDLKAQTQTESETTETGQDQLTQTLPEKPDNGQEPKGEEKTVLITDSTLIYTQEDGTQTQAQLSDISEGMMIKVKMAEDSDMQSEQVTAQSVTVSERKERPENQEGTHTDNQTDQTITDTEEE